VGVLGQTSGNGTGIAVMGQSTTEGAGVYGSISGASHEGAGTVTVGVWGDSGGESESNYFAVLGTADDNAAGVFKNNSQEVATLLAISDATSGDPIVFATDAEHIGGSCSIDANGNLTCNGTITDVVGVEGGARKVALYSIQSAENWFEDFGSGSLSNGGITVTLDSTFAQTVNTGIEYHVFLTPKGDCKGLYVANENARGFDVRELGGGTSSVAFDYRIVAKRMGYETVRLADLTERYSKLDAQHKKMQSRIHPGASPMAIPKPPVLPKAFDQPKLPALSTHAAMEPVAAQTK
jgi:hypothetical protein